MPTITLTHFVDFVSKAGTPKLTVVKNAKQQLADGYDPATDFYKAIRDGIVSMHKKGQPKTALDTVLHGLTDRKKITAYPPLVSGYKKFLGKKEIAWFAPRRDDWSHNGLTVSVNPELGLTIDGTHHAIKLYFKSEALTKLRIDVVTQLMELALDNAKKPMVFAVLDLRNAKLFTSNGVNQGLVALLQGEASSFAQIFKAV
jgi:hypothetical protein